MSGSHWSKTRLLNNLNMSRNKKIDKVFHIKVACLSYSYNSGLDNSSVQWSKTSIFSLSKYLLNLTYPMAKVWTSHPLKKSLSKRSKNWLPRTGKMWEPLAQRKSWNSCLFVPCNCAMSFGCFLKTIFYAL